MTLKGPCDFKLEDFFAAPSELFEPYYGTFTKPPHHTQWRKQKCTLQMMNDSLKP